MPIPDWKLEYIPPNFVRNYWEQVKVGLEVIKEHPQCENWIPEDVYVAIINGTSTLHLGYLDNQYCGFLVLTPMKESYTNKQTLHVWLAYSERHDIHELALQEVEQMARNINASKITLDSPRRGWERRGFKEVQIRYEREV